MGNIITKKAKLHNNYQPNYLRFKLLNSDIIPDGIIHYISIMSTKTQENLALQYKLNDSEWIDYIPNYQYSYNTPYEYPEITVLPQLSDNNDILYIRRKPDAGIIGGVSSLTDLTYFKDNLLSFEMPVNLFTSTPVCIEGNIMSILDATMQSKEVGDYGLHHLFMNTGFAFTENLKLPATILGQYAYYGLFNGTNKGTYTQNVGEISITRYGVVTSTVPKLPATNLSKGCYQEMFSNCAIAQFPELPATVMAEDCYKYMFFNCITSRTLIDYQLPATTLAPNCYHGMFANSKGLFGTLTLPAPVLEEGCYRLMFYGFNKSVNIPVYHSNGFKINWEYTTTLAKDCCMDMFNSAGNIEYSIPEINDLTENCYYQMYANCSITNTGYNIELPATNLAAKCYYGMFYNCDMSLAFSNPIILPATEMKPYCYKYMFAYSGRSFYNIELPAMILAPSCYEGMFIGCSGNTWVPDDNNQIILPAENLVENCYKEMFRESRCCNVYIHAKNTAKSCCEYMFYKSYFVSINSLILRKVTFTNMISLNERSFYGMFAKSSFNNSQNASFNFECTISSVAKESCMYMFYKQTGNTVLPWIQNIMQMNTAESCYYGMYAECEGEMPSSIILSDLTLAENCYYAMFQKTNITIAPQILATTLAAGCCYEMFEGCTNLEKAPELLAESLASYCYKYMFKNCSSLNEIKAHFKELNDTNDTLDWVDGVAQTGDFYKASDAVWTEVGNNGVPSGWTINLI